MAEEKAEEQEQTTPAPAAAPAPAPAGKPTLFIILAIVNMIVVAGVGFMVWQGNQKKEAQPGIDDVIQGEAHEQANPEEAEEVVLGQLIPMETFLVNLAKTWRKN